ncbi:MAG: ANTAR domain-containing protein [Eubacteriales bacterium]|nr:ANTAR domain-containing protein [Eubacteriales bacterium]
MSSSIVIALPKIEDAKKIRTILSRHGISVASICSSAAQALSSISELDCGILICGYRLPDMPYRDLAECLPKYFELLLLASARVINEAPPSVLTVEMPVKVSDLINTVNMMLSQQERLRRKEKNKPKQRSWKEQNYISNAKMLLMQRNHLSEDDAYRYIQKCSMDSGTNMAETAQMVLRLMYDEV